MILLNRLPEGKRNMITLSYDDGSVHDRRLVEIMNRYGIRGTFHLNSGRMAGEKDGWDKIISKEEIPALYKNHEVSCHGVYH
ncbi:MAG: polysaccharide deacetylase family protein, partial [Clostridia bacterium]|nr:polysaccharide deacetylase family protein [Clostridia bacterium]